MVKAVLGLRAQDLPLEANSYPATTSESIRLPYFFARDNLGWSMQNSYRIFTAFSSD